MISKAFVRIGYSTGCLGNGFEGQHLNGPSQDMFDKHQVPQNAVKHKAYFRQQKTDISSFFDVNAPKSSDTPLFTKTESPEAHQTWATLSPNRHSSPYHQVFTTSTKPCSTTRTPVTPKKSTHSGVSK